MVDNWDIDGIAKEILDEMKEEDAGLDEVDYYVHRIAYLSVYSRVPEDATMVAELVREKVVEALENE